jgi:hypothetical protein
MSDGFTAFLKLVGERAERAGVFGAVELKGDMLVCAAKNAAEPAEYRVSQDEGKVWVSLVTPNRWLSESIEAELEHTGDEVEELVEEELAELDYNGAPMGPSQHFRSDDKLFTFRSPAPVLAVDAAAGREAGDDPSGAAATVATCLLAYEACFRRLGDMDASEAG